MLHALIFHCMQPVGMRINLLALRVNGSVDGGKRIAHLSEFCERFLRCTPVCLNGGADLRKLAPHARTLVLCRGAFLFKRHKRNAPLGCALVFRRMLRAQRRKRLLRFFNVLLRGKIPLFEALPVRLRCTALLIDVFDIIPDLCAFKLRFLQLLLRLIHIV